jgi:hypothetical protein
MMTRQALWDALVGQSRANSDSRHSSYVRDAQDIWWALRSLGHCAPWTHLVMSTDSATDR